MLRASWLSGCSEGSPICLPTQLQTCSSVTKALRVRPAKIDTWRSGPKIQGPGLARRPSNGHRAERDYGFTSTGSLTEQNLVQRPAVCMPRPTRRLHSLRASTLESVSTAQVVSTCLPGTRVAESHLCDGSIRAHSCGSPPLLTDSCTSVPPALRPDPGPWQSDALNAVYLRASPWLRDFPDCYVHCEQASR